MTTQAITFFLHYLLHTYRLISVLKEMIAVCVNLGLCSSLIPSYTKKLKKNSSLHSQNITVYELVLNCALVL